METNIRQPYLSSSDIISQHFYLLILILFCLTIQTKSPGISANRILHYPGIAILFIWSIWVIRKSFLPKLIARLTPGSSNLLLLLLAIYIYRIIMLQGGDIRYVKDFIIGSSVDAGFFIFLTSLVIVYNFSRDKLILFLSYSFLLFALIASLHAWASYLFPGFFYSLSEFLAHNSRWGFRLHSFFGEPTHYGAAVGLGILSSWFLLDLQQQTNRKRFVILIALLIMGTGLFGSGSRNSLLSLFVPLVVLFWLGDKRKTIKLLVIVFIGGFLLTQAILFGTNFLNNITSAQSATSSTTLKENKSTLQTTSKAFRLKDPTANSTRIARLKQKIKLVIHDSALSTILVGRRINGLRKLSTSFNSYLDGLIDFGVLFILLWAAAYFYIAKIYLSNILRKQYSSQKNLALFGLVIFIYGLVFGANYSGFFYKFFHIVNLTLIISFSLSIIISLKQGSESYSS